MVFPVLKEVAEDRRNRKRNFSVSGVLKKLGVSKAGYTAYLEHRPSNREKRRKRIMNRIVDIHNESHQIYGAPKITVMLKKQGFAVAERTVGVYMKQLGIKAVWIKPKKRTTINSDFSSLIFIMIYYSPMFF